MPDTAFSEQWSQDLSSQHSHLEL